MPRTVLMNKEPRLQFTKEERADPALEKPIRKADRAADQAEKARAKIPKKKIRFEETVTDPATGKTVTRLRFEEIDKKKPPSKLSHAVRDAPGNAVLSKVHKEIRESEEDNVGVESAHKVEPDPDRRLWQRIQHRKTVHHGPDQGGQYLLPDY